MDKQRGCALCGKSEAKLCSGCHTVAYCTTEHQRDDWKNHKQFCKPYVVKRNNILGRYLVAARDLRPGCVIIQEKCMVVGPKQDTLPVCLGCHKKLWKGSYRCSKCLLPLCSKNCEKAKYHAEFECRVFAKQKIVRTVKIKDETQHHPVYESIMTLRCLCLRGMEGQKEWNILNEMEHHSDFRRNYMPKLWERNEVNVVQFLNKKCGIDLEPNRIHEVIGYTDINSFEIKSRNVECCGIFPVSSLMAHDCISNTHHSITEDYEMIVRSAVSIKKGDMITTTYASTLESTLSRRSTIKESKAFDCACQRCCDPTELGTFFSAIRCFKKCSNTDGYMLPKDPLNYESDWTCRACGVAELSNKVELLFESLREELEQLEQSATASFITDLESFISKKKGHVLHPNNFLIVSALYSLSQAYGRVNGWLIDDLTSNQLKRKEYVCRELLRTIDIFEPGMSRIRGVTLYELHSAVLYGAKTDFEEGVIQSEGFRTKALEALSILKTSEKILLFDDSSSATGKIARTIPMSVSAILKAIDQFCNG